MEENENAIEVQSVIKRFGSKTAVNSLSFHVPKGSITGFIGPNGAGKTTTMRMLATLLAPDIGSVKIFGCDVRSDSKKIRHHLGFMPDYFGLYEDMEVYEYLDFFAAAYHIPAVKRAKLVPDILQLLDLVAKKDALVTELSRGMQQRLSLGRALVHDPKLLLLDEPASGLDPRARIELMALLQELRNMGKTIFISSHILAELKNLCDYAVIIERGKLIYSGSVSDAATVVSGSAGKMRIVVENKAHMAIKDLETLTGVSELEAQSETILSLEYDIDKISSAQIIKFLVNKDYQIEEAVKESINLEDVFMSLTEGGVA